MTPCVPQGHAESTAKEASTRMINVVYTALVAILWGLFALSFHQDRSRYRNCYLLFLALVVTVVALTFLTGSYQKDVLIFIMWVVFVALLIVPVFLVCNGIVMIRREGHSLANLLSLGLGIVVGLGEVAAFASIIMTDSGWIDPNAFGFITPLSRVGALASASVFYFSMTFVVFMLYCVFLQIIPFKRDFDYVVIHGAGLLDGDRVSKLLSDRIDKAIEVYGKDPTPPILIPSGGQGADESISEAEAMRRYLVGKGIPAEHIIAEGESATTYENLANSKAIIDARGGSAYTALVTSNYHVYRALRYCRQIGLKCVGVGSRVAFYYWPSALIREYVAVHAERKRLVTLLIGWVLFIAPMVLSWR